MEDKRKEEIKQKVDAIGACLEEIKLCEEELAKISEAFEFIERYWYCDIWAKAVDDEDSSKVEEFKIPLTVRNRSKVIDVIKDRFTEEAEEYRDEILKRYEEMDKLLK